MLIEDRSLFKFCIEKNVYQYEQQKHLFIAGIGIVSLQNVLDDYLENGEHFYLDTTGIGGSFVLHDAGKNLIIAFGDFFGLYPLFYGIHKTEDSFIFGFSVKAIAESGLVELAINPTKIHTYFDWKQADKPLSDQTFFLNIFRVLPAHVLVVKNGKSFLQPYAKINPNRFAKLEDEAYSRYFKKFFVASVARSIEPYTKIAADLSGGLDSSAVCGVAQSLSHSAIHTMYMDSRSELGKEEDFVLAVVEKWKTYHHHLGPALNVYQVAEIVTAQTAQPEIGNTPFAMHLPKLQTAQEEGCEVYLAGNGGDAVVGYGFDYVQEIYELEQWETLKTTVDKIVQNPYILHRKLFPKWNQWSVSMRASVYATRFFLIQVKKTKDWRSVFSKFKVLRKYFEFTGNELVAILQSLLVPKERIYYPTHKFVRDNFPMGDKPACSIDVSKWVTQKMTARQHHQLEMTFFSLPQDCYVRNYQLFNAEGMARATPYLDIDLLELCLGTPLRVRFGQGLGRTPQREGLREYYPENVANRTSKAEFSGYAHEAFLSIYDEFKQKNSHNHSVWNIINKRSFERSLSVVVDEKIPPHLKSTHIMLCSRVIYLAIWLTYIVDLKATKEHASPQ